MQRNTESHLGYNVLGFVFLGLIVFMGALTVVNIVQELITKH